MSGRLLTGPRFGLSGGRGGAFRTLVTDTFTRVDTTGPLGTADSGQTWETIAGTAFGISSNQAYNTDTANTLCISTIDSATYDGRVACTVTRTTQVAGVVVRLSDASNYWYVSLSGSATALIKVVAGSPTTVATTAATFSGATSVEVALSGNSFSVSFNGVVLLTGTGVVPPNEFTLAAGDVVALDLAAPEDKPIREGRIAGTFGNVEARTLM